MPNHYVPAKLVLTGKIANHMLFGHDNDISGDIYVLKADKLIEDGDILIAGKLDAHGRSMVRGRHTNFGYSGYLVGTLYVDGQSRRIKNWLSLFPGNENRYNFQQEKSEAADRVSIIVEKLKGITAVRVLGGWMIDHKS